MASTNDLIPHILHPLPNVVEIQKPPNREERLKVIISNLEDEHNSVKSRIVQAAKSRRAITAVQHGVEAMDVGPECTLSSHTEVMDQMFASLNTLHKESMGDPYLRQDAGIPSPPLGTNQTPPTPEMQLAKEALDQIELYESLACKTKKFHKDALDRERRRSSSGGSGVAGPWNVSRTNSTSVTSHDPSLVNASPRELPRVNASHIDISRDPRLRR